MTGYIITSLLENYLQSNPLSLILSKSEYLQHLHKNEKVVLLKKSLFH